MRSAALLLLLAAPALAEEPAYRDDRSGATAIVASYYNAVARQEYARAWSYFGEAKPVADYAAFVAGYADTAAVELRLGTPVAEGAAGSLYETLPVAIAATGTDGKVRVFAGCTVTRLLQPANQEPPFAPLHIETATLHAVSAPLAEALPASCE